MEFKDAFRLILGMHEQCGDHHGWNNLRQQLEVEVSKFKSFQRWQSNIHMRSDLSDDIRFMLEDHDASIEILFKLVSK